jgi:hypothetical protein
MTQIQNQLIDLYYYSLESLKNATTSDYQSDFAYALPTARFNDTQIKARLTQKQPALDEFAKQLALTPTFETFKIITKGKWLIELFADQLLQTIAELPGWCKNQQITTCRFCLNQSYDKCLYRLKPGFHKNTLKSLALTHPVGGDFDYILTRLANLSQGTNH